MAQADSNTSTPAPAPGECQDSLYFDTGVSPEQMFRAIGKLRKDARDEIDRLIRFLDTTDDYVSRELEDNVDDGPIDDNEPDGPENGEDEESDPAEPSLGSLERQEWADQESWAAGGRADLEDEHDGAEPDDEGDNNENDEPSPGWPERMNAGSQSGDDRELQQ